MNTTLKLARIKKGLSQKEVAACAKITSKYMSKIECEGLLPSPATMKKISACLGVSVQELFFSEEA